MDKIRKRDGKSDEWKVLNSSRKSLKTELKRATEKILTDEQEKYLKGKNRDNERKSDELKGVDEKYRRMYNMFTDKQKNKLIEIWVTSEKGKKHQEDRKKMDEIKEREGKSDKWAVLDSSWKNLTLELETITGEILTEEQQELIEKEDLKRKPNELKGVDKKYRRMYNIFTDKQKNKLMEIWVTSEKGKKYQEDRKKMDEIRKREGKSDEWAVLDSSRRSLKKELDRATKEVLTDKQKKYLEEQNKKDENRKKISYKFEKTEVNPKYEKLRSILTGKQKEK